VPTAVLIGPPGSGKSTVGKAISKKLNLDFKDTDAEIEKRAGKSVAAIFIEDGEPSFREMEREVVLDLLEGFGGILALGGGSITDETVCAALKEGDSPVVYLEVSLAQAAPRVGFNKDRPLLLVNPRAQWQALMEKRRPVYESLATCSFSTDSAKAPEIAQLIIDSLHLSDASSSK
jgi:shikimate kinase